MECRHQRNICQTFHKLKNINYSQIMVGPMLPTLSLPSPFPSLQFPFRNSMSRTQNRCRRSAIFSSAAFPTLAHVAFPAPVPLSFPTSAALRQRPCSFLARCGGGVSPSRPRRERRLCSLARCGSAPASPTLSRCPSAGRPRKIRWLKNQLMEGVKSTG